MSERDSIDGGHRLERLPLLSDGSPRRAWIKSSKMVRSERVPSPRIHLESYYRLGSAKLCTQTAAISQLRSICLRVFDPDPQAVTVFPTAVIDACVAGLYFIWEPLMRTDA